MQLFVWNDSGTTLPNNMNWTLLCAYPASNFPGGEDERAFNTICAEHSAVRSPLNNLPNIPGAAGWSVSVPCRKRQVLRNWVL